MKKKGLLKLAIPILLVMVLAIALSLVGCAPGKAPAGPATAEPIKVGGTWAITGPYAADGQNYYRGMDFALDEINASGGVLGRPLELVPFDIKDFAPELLAQAADQLCGVDKVHMVNGGWAGWGGDYRAFGKYDVPFFNIDAATTSLEVFREDPVQYSNCFMMEQVETGFGLEYVDFMNWIPYDYPNNKVALIAADDAWGRGLTGAVQEKAEQTGWEVVMYEVVPYGTREWAPILTKIRTQEPAWLVIEICSPPEVITFFDQFMEQPTNTILNYGYSWAAPEFLEIMGEEGNGITGLGSVLPHPGPTAKDQELAAAYEARYGTQFNPASVCTYASLYVWKEAVEAVGDVTDYAAINEYLATHAMEVSPSLVYSFNEDQVATSEVLPFAYMQIQDGDFVSIYWKGEAYTDYAGTTYEFQVPPWFK